MPRLLARDFGTSLLFDAANTKDTVATNASVDFTGAFTVTAWIKPRSFGEGSAGRIVDKENGSNGYIVLVTTGGILRLSNSAVASDSPSNTIILNQWQHIAVVYTRTTARFFVNGTLIVANSYSTDPITNAGDLVIGNNAAQSRTFDGYMDEVRLWNTSLTDTAIADLYYRGIAPSSGLVVEHLFNEGTGSTATDTSGSSNNGTLTAATYSTDVPMRARLVGRDFGTALSFISTTSKVDCGSDFIGTSACTITAWIKPFNLGANNGGRILDNGKAILKLNPTNTIQFTSDGTTFNSVTNGIPTFGNWMHVAVTRDASGNCSIYINGVLANTATSGTPVAGTTNVLIGNANSGTRSWNGNLDQVVVFNSVLTATQISTLYYNGILPSGQLATYLFNEGSGTTATDSSGFGNNGTITGATYTTDVPMRSRQVVRDSGTALSFNGSTTTVTSASTGFGASVTQVAMEAWINLNVDTSQSHVIWGRAGASDEYLFINTSNKPVFSLNIGGSKTLTGNIILRNGVWYHIVGTYDGVNMSIYVNGVLDSQLAQTGTSSDTNVVWYVGNKAGSFPFNGKIDLARLWSTGLTASQAMTLYTSNTKPSSGLVIEYLFNEGAGASATDTSGNSNTGTIVAGTYTADVPMKARALVGGNLVKNGSFSFVPPGAIATNTSDRWIDGTAAGSTTNDLFGWRTYFEYGATALISASDLTITSTASAPSANHQISVSPVSNTVTAANVLLYLIPIENGVAYTITFEMQTTSITSANARGARVNLTTYSGDTTGSTAAQASDYISGTTAWTPYTITFTNSANRRWLQIACEIRGEQGTADFRNIKAIPSTNTVRTAVT